MVDGDIEHDADAFLMSFPYQGDQSIISTELLIYVEEVSAVVPMYCARAENGIEVYKRNSQAFKVIELILYPL